MPAVTQLTSDGTPCNFLLPVAELVKAPVVLPVLVMLDVKLRMRNLLLNCEKERWEFGPPEAHQETLELELHDAHEISFVIKAGSSQKLTS